jgi:acetyl esterase/lipase
VHEVVKQFLIFSSIFLLCGCSVTHLGKSTQSEALEKDSTRFDVYRDISYIVRDSGALNGDLYVPQGRNQNPAVILIHGGSWSGRSNADMESIATRLASSGFAVFNINYRLVPEFLFPAQIEDCQDAVRWMRDKSEQYRIDPTRIASFGYSAGGHLASLLGVLDDSETDGSTSWKVQAVVAGATPHNLLMYPYSPAVTSLLGTTIAKDVNKFISASPIHHVSKDDAPFFIYHGTWDTLVDPNHSQEMKEALDNVGVENELYLVSGLGHIALFLFDDSTVENAIDFLNRHLRD